MASNLPFELLVKVFSNCISNPPSTTSASPEGKRAWIAYFKGVQPIYITQVSRNWRAAALGTPSLWATWYIDIDNPPALAIDYIGTFLRRTLAWSSNSPLTFRICVSETSDKPTAAHEPAEPKTDPLFQSVVDIICREQHRWRDVELDLPNCVRCKIRPRMFAALNSLNLHALHRVADDSIGSQSVDSQPYYKLYLSEAQPLHVPSTLRIRLSRNYTKLLEDFANATALNSLHISFAQWPANIHVPQPEPPIVMTGLRRLELAGDPRVQRNPLWGFFGLRYSSDFVRLLGRLHCRALDTLVLHDASDTVIRVVTKFLQQCSPPLTSLTVKVRVARYMHEDCDPALAQLLECVPSLQEFELHHSRGIAVHTILRRLSEKNDNGTFLLVPGLQTLYASQISAKRDDFKEFINSRRNSPRRTLLRVQYDRCEGRIGDNRRSTLSWMGTWRKEIHPCVADGLKSDVVVGMDEVQIIPLILSSSD